LKTRTACNDVRVTLIRPAHSSGARGPCPETLSALLGPHRTRSILTTEQTLPTVRVHTSVRVAPAPLVAPAPYQPHPPSATRTPSPPSPSSRRILENVRHRPPRPPPQVPALPAKLRKVRIRLNRPYVPACPLTSRGSSYCAAWPRLSRSVPKPTKPRTMLPFTPACSVRQPARGRGP
jgi:hypothetical protein